MDVPPPNRYYYFYLLLLSLLLFVGWRRFVGEHSWLLVVVNVVLICCFVLASCLGMKVCIANNQRIGSWKCTRTETLDKNKKTLILVFRCWHYKTNGQSLWKSFEVTNEMFISIVFVFKLSLSICNVVLSSLYSKLQFSHVATYHIIEGTFYTNRPSKQMYSFHRNCFPES